MAGTDPSFNSSEFRAAIRFAMEMGAAPDPAKRLSFHFPSVLTYNAPVDGDHVPFDPNATVTKVEPTPLTGIDCAVEYFDAENQPTNFGMLAPSRITVTLLDEEYEKVQGCAYVVAHGDRYDYRRTEPPSGLFDVGVYILHFTARSET